MIICICNDYTQCEIEQAILDNPHLTIHQIYELLGAPPRCGACVGMSEFLLTEIRKSGKLPSS